MNDTRRTILDRLLGLLSVVRPGEGRRAVVMLVNVFLLLTAYYVIKTVREPMILADGSAELKSWASAGQAVALLAFVPAYGWLSSRLPRRLLIVAVSGFFVLCLQAFYPSAVEATRVTAAMERGTEAAEEVSARASDVLGHLAASRSFVLFLRTFYPSAAEVARVTDAMERGTETAEQVSARASDVATYPTVSGCFVGRLHFPYPLAVEATRALDAIERGTEAADRVSARASGVAGLLGSPAPSSDGAAVAGPGAVADDDETRGIRPAEFLKLGFVFYVWVGIFSLAMIAQFWSFANDIYTREQGDRLFPIIALGATAGAAFGSKITSMLFSIGVGIPAMLQVATAILVVHAAIMWGTSRAVGREHARTTGRDDDTPVPPGAAFAIVLRSPYLRLIAVVILLLNLVNTNGEYILSRMVLDAAKALEAAGTIDAIGPYIGWFYGDFFSVVNVATLVVQGLLVSRIVRYAGIRGVLLLLPVVALGTYAALAAGVGLAMYRWAKTAENTTDYSVMNTAKALVWLPTTREEKYKGKQAIDSFVVRLGDLAATGLMVLGTQVFAWSVRGFAAANVVLVAVWLVAVLALVRRYRELVRHAAP